MNCVIYKGKLLTVFFYPEELNVIHRDRVQHQEFKIEKILRSKGTGSRKQYFVSWIGYTAKFNSWVPAHDLREL